MKIPDKEYCQLRRWYVHVTVKRKQILIKKNKLIFYELY
jgi:hypothetical protein